MNVAVRPLNGLALCAGGGGLELGLRLALGDAYRCVGYVEQAPFAAATLVARMADQALDDAPVWDDVASFDGRPWRGLVDIITTGFPCQPFSEAGQHRGIATAPSASSSPTWPTSASMRNGRCYLRPTSEPATGETASGYSLTGRAIRLWPTPCASNPNDGESPVSWFARAVRRERRQRGSSCGMSLPVAAKLWPTHLPPGWRRRLAETETADFLPGSVSFHRPPRTMTAGARRSPTSRVLNPRFLEWLMGWPIGWTDPDCSATASYRWWRQRHSAALHDALACWQRPTRGPHD
jgi:hypothetical protein